MIVERADILVDGAPGSGPALVLEAPISFWGGVDPKSGRIADVRHPHHGEGIADERRHLGVAAQDRLHENEALVDAAARIELHLDAAVRPFLDQALELGVGLAWRDL